MAATETGNLTARELLIAGAIAYWCEGCKTKPHRRIDRVIFMNSDPSLIRFFLRFLDTTGTPSTDLRFRVYIHEVADAESAPRFGMEVTGAPLDQFFRPTLKRHKSEDGAEERGRGLSRLPCIHVHRSAAGLYHKIEGWDAASMAVTPGGN